MRLHRAIIHACVGGGGNHLRWLLLLDPEFSIFDGGPVSDKVDYILDQVYPASRHQGNWLEFELKYRNVLNDYIKFAHSDFSPGWELRPGQFDSKINYLMYPADMTRTLQLSRSFYRKSFTDSEIRLFVETVQTERAQAELYAKTQNGLLIDPDDLHSVNLDQLLYNKICNFGNFKDCYPQAKQIHKAWWEAKTRLTGDVAVIKPLLCPYVITEIT